MVSLHISDGVLCLLAFCEGNYKGKFCRLNFMYAKCTQLKIYIHTLNNLKKLQHDLLNFRKSNVM